MNMIWILIHSSTSFCPSGNRFCHSETVHEFHTPVIQSSEGLGWIFFSLAKNLSVGPFLQTHNITGCTSSAWEKNNYNLIQPKRDKYTVQMLYNSLISVSDKSSN